MHVLLCALCLISPGANVPIQRRTADAHAVNKPGTLALAQR